MCVRADLLNPEKLTKLNNLRISDPLRKMETTRIYKHAKQFIDTDLKKWYNE